LHIWEKWGDPFHAQYKIWDMEYWNNFWDKCRFISPDPCKFIQGGMIDRGLSEEFRNWWDWDHPKQYVDPNLKNMRDD